MTTTKPRTCKFQLGQSVEVQTPDFAAPGMPLVWRSARVVQVEANGQLFDVAVRFDGIFDKNGDGLIHRELVGPRGGNSKIRAAA
jgi:hypothetical protein